MSPGFNVRSAADWHRVNGHICKFRRFDWQGLQYTKTYESPKFALTLNELILGEFMNYWMKSGACILAMIISSHAASAATCDLGQEGTYTNHALDTNVGPAQVTVSVAPKNTMTFEVRIPCGIHLSPATLYATCQENSVRYETVIVQDRGLSQCSLGTNLRITIVGDVLTISTDIRTPGFNGRYRFSRQ